VDVDQERAAGHDLDELRRALHVAGTFLHGLAAAAPAYDGRRGGADEEPGGRDGRRLDGELTARARWLERPRLGQDRQSVHHLDLAAGLRLVAHAAGV
jgi:hypothetical protein